MLRYINLQCTCTCTCTHTVLYFQPRKLQNTIVCMYNVKYSTPTCIYVHVLWQKVTYMYMYTLPESDIHVHVHMYTHACILTVHTMYTIEYKCTCTVSLQSHLVDEAVDGLLQSLPSQSLVSHRVLVCDTLLHHSESSWRNVGSSRPR